MATAHGSKARLYVAGYDLTGFMRAATHAQSADTADASVWGLASKRYVAGLADATLSGEGIVDSAVAGGRSDDVLQAALGSSAPSAIYLPQGDGLGMVARIIDAIGTAYEIDSPGDDVTAFSMEMQGSGVSGVGRVLQPLAGALSIVANGNGAAVDDTSYLTAPAVTAFGGTGALQVVNKGGGAGTLTVSIQDSADGSTGWVTIGTFAGVTLINQAQVIAISGNVRRYLRASWAITGGTWDIAVAFARRMQ